LGIIVDRLAFLLARFFRRKRPRGLSTGSVVRELRDERAFSLARHLNETAVDVFSATKQEEHKEARDRSQYYIRVTFERLGNRVKLTYKFPPVGKCRNVAMHVEDDYLIVEAECDEATISEIEKKMDEFDEYCL
jgi:hypothetical protein